MERPEFASILNLRQEIPSEGLAEFKDQVCSLRSTRMGMAAFQDLDQWSLNTRKCPHGSTTGSTSAVTTPNAPSAFEVDHPPSVSVDAVRMFAQAGEVVPLSPNPVGRTLVPWTIYTSPARVKPCTPS